LTEFEYELLLKTVKVNDARVDDNKFRAKKNTRLEDLEKVKGGREQIIPF
jgi:hypothetical protein